MSLLTPEQQKLILIRHTFPYLFALAMHFSPGLWPLWNYFGNRKVGKYCFNHKMQLPLSDYKLAFPPDACGQPRNIQTPAALACLCKHLQHAHRRSEFFSLDTHLHQSSPVECSPFQLCLLLSVTQVFQVQVVGATHECRLPMSSGAGGTAEVGKSLLAYGGGGEVRRRNSDAINFR